ncbi:MAG: adenylate/guanylate cyclase domain-containing protein [Acidobacteriota bacterium]|jgi:class 3 adenylate cyclase|nr:adenylate/guanylate cyclase domain-containing protein [Acidobacteriota bacterium]
MSNTANDNNEPVSQRNSRANLEKLLTEMIEEPERRAEMTKQIEEIFGQEKAVMVLDMSGFSRTTQRHGIVSYLQMIHAMRSITKPCVEAHRGLLVKAEADNLFCLFDTVADAIRAGQDITRHLNAANVVLPESRRLYVSIGIGYGTLLNVADEDLYGNEVNLASKLGEDIGGMADILLTAAAHERLQAADVACREEVISISGIELPYFVVEGH